MPVQAIWDWRIVAETFLGGMGAVLFIIATIIDLWKHEEHRTIVKLGITFGVSSVILTVVILLTEIGRPERAFLIFTNSNPYSAITVGSFFLTVFILLGLVTMILWLTKWKRPRLTVEVINSLVAIGVVLYPGFIFASVKAIPAWGTAAMPILVLFTSILTGVSMSAILLAGTYYIRKGGEGEKVQPILHLIPYLRDLSIGLVVLQIISVISYLIILQRGPELAIEAFQRATGPLAILLFGVVIVAGLVLPLVLLGIAKLVEERREAALTLVLLAAILILVGGLSLRLLILDIGVLHPLFPPTATGPP